MGDRTTVLAAPPGPEWHRVVITCDDTTAKLREILHWLKAEGLSQKGRQVVLERDRAGWPPQPLRLVLGFADPRIAMAVKIRWG